MSCCWGGGGRQHRMPGLDVLLRFLADSAREQDVPRCPIAISELAKRVWVGGNHRDDRKLSNGYGHVHHLLISCQKDGFRNGKGTLTSVHPCKDLSKTECQKSNTEPAHSGAKLRKKIMVHNLNTHTILWHTCQGAHEGNQFIAHSLACFATRKVALTLVLVTVLLRTQKKTHKGVSSITMP